MTPTSSTSNPFAPQYLVNPTVPIPEQLKTRMQREAYLEVRAIADGATADDRAHAQQIMERAKRGPHPSVELMTLTPGSAAVLLIESNSFNRGLDVARARGYANDLAKGQFLPHHQGIAFYPDGILGDGQHRLFAIAVAKRPYELPVYFGLTKEAVEVIDQPKQRNLGEYLSLQGVSDSSLKSQMASEAIKWPYWATGAKVPRHNNMEKEQWIRAHQSQLERAIQIGRRSTATGGEVVLEMKEASYVALGLLLNHMNEAEVLRFVEELQVGAASFPDAPPKMLWSILDRAAKRRTETRLNISAKVALAIKAAKFWLKQQSVAKLSWNGPRKEVFPTLTDQVDDAGPSVSSSVN